MNTTNILHDLMKNGGSHGLVCYDPEARQFSIPMLQGGRQQIPYSLAEIVIRKFNGFAVYDPRTKDLWRI